MRNFLPCPALLPAAGYDRAGHDRAATAPLLITELTLTPSATATEAPQGIDLQLEAWSVLGCGLGPDPLVEDSFLPVRTGLGGQANDTLWVTRANGFDYQQQEGVYNLTTAAVSARLAGPSLPRSTAWLSRPWPWPSLLCQNA